MRFFPLVLVFVLILGVVRADLYMHNPPGSNDRNRERNDNRNNANRMFDSQNNAAGGYPWRGDATANGVADPITYYVGSKLRIEWTNQHACGTNPNIHCQLVVQYACNDKMPGLRDGYPTGDLVTSDNDEDTNGEPDYQRRAFATTNPAQNQQGTNRINENQPESYYAEGTGGGIQFGLHESIESYKRCRATTRNKGLYLSDQDLQSKHEARFTRQNPNGGRRGLECPEERDYYPYWRRNEWTDAAVLVSETKWCEYYQENSQNVRPMFECVCDEDCQNAANNDKIPINALECGTAGGVWREYEAPNLPKPVCKYHPLNRDNHLGNSLQVNEDGQPIIGSEQEPSTPFLDWEIPADMADKECILRLRYNMSTADYTSMAFALNDVEGVGFDGSKNCPRIKLTGTNDNGDSTNNGGDVDQGGNEDVLENSQCINQLTENSRPLYNRPYIQFFDDADPQLSLAINTHQTGRTFQDRSYVFKVANSPDGISNIHNLNFRGRRGNIVQAYPSVEYDFVPQQLKVDNGDFVHIQFHGSDFNQAKNANNGEGWKYSDRTNMVQMTEATLNYPAFQTSIGMFDSVETRKKWALLGQDQGCLPFVNGGNNQNNGNNEQNSVYNCGKLNRVPARYPPDPAAGLVKMSNSGTFHYVSTRNNNFSNRSQKASITVGESSLSPIAIAGIVIGAVAGVALLVAGVCYYGKRNPNSVVGGWYSGTIGGGSSNAAAPTTHNSPPPDMDYQRH